MPSARLKLFAAALAAPVLLASVSTPIGAQPPFGGRGASNRVPPTVADIVYATVGGEALMLDLYLPDDVANPLLLIFVHGGAWSRGSRDTVNNDALLDHGFAIASVSFRLTAVPLMPAQIHDIKAAIRFLRANADEYGFNADRIGLTGVSSGGHLAALVGMTNGSEAHEGTVGDYDDVSSDVHAVVTYFGASNLTTILAQSTPSGLDVREPAIGLLLDGTLDEKPDLARLASPVFQIDPADPPILILHGDQDTRMPINQAHELHGAAKAAGLDTELIVLHGAGHGAREFFDEERTQLVAAFLQEALAR